MNRRRHLDRWTWHRPPPDRTLELESTAAGWKAHAVEMRGRGRAKVPTSVVSAEGETAGSALDALDRALAREETAA